MVIVKLLLLLMAMMMIIMMMMMMWTDVMTCNAMLLNATITLHDNG